MALKQTIAQKLVYMEESIKSPLISISFSKNTTVFQAEVVAGESVAFLSDSQATFNAISLARVDSKLVRDCVSTLHKVGSPKKINFNQGHSHKDIYREMRQQTIWPDAVRQGNSLGLALPSVSPNRKLKTPTTNRCTINPRNGGSTYHQDRDRQKTF